MRAFVAGAVVCLSFVISAAAWAAGPADLNLAWETAVKDDGQPAIVLRPRVSIRDATFTFVGPDGAPQVVRTGAVRAGATKRLKVAHGEGKSTYAGTADVQWTVGLPGSYTFEFEAARYRTLKMEMAWEDVDLERRTATCRANHEVASVEVTVEASDGLVLAQAKQVFDPPAPGGTELTVAWAELPDGETPARITVKTTDPLGVWASMKATPFTITIPHDEVEFALGDAAIRASEVPKLEKTLDEMRRALKQHGTLLDLKLFIAGFTDTVGPSDANAALSLRRAGALAKWFRARGVRLAIYYRGFGESALAVATPDETDEPRNRRALYILSVHPPLGVQVARGDEAAGWARL